MATPDGSHALDHIVVVLFENRSLDNVLGHLYGPEDGKNFDGVIGKNLSNPIPEWAEHGADRKVVPYAVATDMDAPNPDSGEEYFHTNTQLYNTLDEQNRFKIGEEVTEPWNAPPPGATPTMDGFVTDYISHLHRGDRSPAHLRRIRPHHDRLHPGAAAGAERHRPRVRGLRPLVLRGTVANVHEPLVLDGGDIVRDRREQPGEEVVQQERRGDDLRAARATRQDLEDLRDGADDAVVSRHHPLLPPEGSAGNERGAVRRVREGRSRRNSARLLAHRAELHRRARRLPSGVRSRIRPSDRR